MTTVPRPRVVLHSGGRVVRPRQVEQGRAFADRSEAGWRLAERLERFRGEDPVVLGLPRGGVPVASQVAAALDAPLDVIVVRKLGLPFQPEVAMGAIGEDGVQILDQDAMGRAAVSAAELAVVETRERRALEARIRRYRCGRERIDLTGRTAIIVDDGVATGSTAQVACRIARLLGAATVVLAVPVGSARGLDSLTEADEVVAVEVPEPFVAVGRQYDDFSPTADDEVVVLLDRAARRVRGLSAGDPPDCDTDVTIALGDVTLSGHLHLPDVAPVVVILAEASNRSRHSPRTRLVADVLYDAGFGVLLLDLLGPAEECDRVAVFDIALLAGRLAGATEWVRSRSESTGCRVGYLGAGTGAAAALWSAADGTEGVDAVVSRGGRPDLAGERLSRVPVPTLLIVGGDDVAVLDGNRRALAALPPDCALSVVESAGHLFEERGALAEASLLARDWFAGHLVGV